MTFIFLYCVLQGIATSTCYFVPLICGWEWYPNNKGLVTGIILGGYGVGAFTFGNISTMLVNPNEENPNIYDTANDVTYYDSHVADRVPFMFRTLVYMWSVVVLLSLFLIRRKEEPTRDVVAEILASPLSDSSLNAINEEE